MRRSTPLLSAAVLAMLGAAACSTAEQQPTAVASSAPRPVASSGVPDLSAPPDLIVDARATEQNWVVRVEDLPANFCSVQEGGVTPGTHTIIRFTVTTPNIGKGDVFVGSPLDHMDPNHDGSYADQDGLFEFASCHGHFHFQHYATYKLIDSKGQTWKAAKRGFCMLDTDPFNVNNGDGTWTYRSCGDLTHDGFQGISSGWADTYVFKLGGQYFVLDGGDGQPVVPPGQYTIEVEVNPAYAPDKKGVCPRVTDPLTGLCHQFAETDYTNNIGRASVNIPDHPGRSGYGPLKNDNTKITASDEVEK
ncbi:MAG TPA: lysyl oxidase family protein [Gemmatimonadaceae bacterium]|nr:lysyl oxidase family protein [Gemmatimonadaceae bacterium]